jgi:hypothetical protein
LTFDPGLRGASAELIVKAMERTEDNITKLLISFFVTSFLCATQLRSPDSELLTAHEKVSLPILGGVSLLSLTFLGPALMAVFWVMTIFNLRHWTRLERIRQAGRVRTTPAILLIRWKRFRQGAAYAMGAILWLTLAAFAWKAAVFPRIGSIMAACNLLMILAATLIVKRVATRHCVIIFGICSVLCGLLVFHVGGVLHRPFDLGRADLTGLNLNNVDLRGANLVGATLKNALLGGTDLRGADLSYADLSCAYLSGAKMKDSSVEGANFHRAWLWDTDMREVGSLQQNQISQSCGSPGTFFDKNSGLHVEHSCYWAQFASPHCFE